MSVFTGALLFLGGVLLNSISQIMLKRSAMKTYPSVIREYLNVLVVGAYVICVGVTFVFATAYKVLPLSMGPVLESAGYIFVTILGALIFGEKINSRKVLALAIIVAGIAVFSFFG